MRVVHHCDITEHHAYWQATASIPNLFWHHYTNRMLLDSNKSNCQKSAGDMSKLPNYFLLYCFILDKFLALSLDEEGFHQNFICDHERSD